MPRLQTAKQIAENALMTIGAFSTSQAQADAGELRRALKWLEMLLNSMSAIRPIAGFWRIIDIPLEAGIGDYNLADYVDAAGIQHLFSVNLVNDLGDVEPLTLMFENDSVVENLTDASRPERAVITKDASPVLKLYPTPTSTEEDAGYKVRLRIQTYQEEIDHTGIADTDLLVRPGWYLCITKKLAYEIGSGPVRTLEDGELKRIKSDGDTLESQLLARDGQYNTGAPPVTEPMEGSY